MASDHRPFHEPLVHIGEGALQAFLDYVKEKGFRSFHLVADANTWRALGERVAAMLRAAGCAVTAILLTGKEIIADEEQIVQVMLPAGGDAERVYLAVGSGTITDVTRFASHRMGRPFIALPTAPSVDAYTSPNAPLVIRRLKKTLPAQVPLAVFADLEALRRAPRPMIAAGFGDMLGKYTCLADWHLGALLWDEPYDAEAASQAQRALAEVVAQAEAIGALQVEGIRVLMEALCASGLAMARVGHSRPASGSEHHLSHFWEQKLLSEGRPALLHGAKVGVATVLMAGAYARLRRLSRAEVARRLETVLWPSPEEQRAEIRTAYGPLADDMIADHAAFIEMLPERAAEVRERILLHWGDIQEIATSVPAPQDLADLLEHAGGVSRAEDLGLTSEEVALAYRVAHYMRARFTVRKVEIALGL